MTYERPSIQDLLDFAQCWRLSQDGSITVSILINDALTSLPIPDEELGEFHSLLPYIIRSCFEVDSSPDSPKFATGKHVFCNYQVILGQLPIYKSSKGLFSMIYDLHSKRAYQTQSFLSSTHAVADVVFFEKALGTGPHIPVVKRILACDIEVDNHFWDLHYSGWQQRWAAGEELGLTSTNLLLYTFPPFSKNITSEPCVSLNGLTF